MAELHEGSLVSGTITCSCGWSSGHYAHAGDAHEAFNWHLKGYDVIVMCPACESLVPTEFIESEKT